MNTPDKKQGEAPKVSDQQLNIQTTNEQRRDAQIRALRKALTDEAKRNGRPLTAAELDKIIANQLLDWDLPGEIKESAQKAIKSAIEKTADKSVELQNETLQKIYIILQEAAQKANDAQFNNTDDYRRRFTAIQDELLRKYIAQATVGNEMMTSVGSLAMAAGVLFSAFGNTEKGAELVSIGQGLIDHYSKETLKLQKQMESRIYGPNAEQIARATQGNKALGDSIHGRVGPLDDYAGTVGGKMDTQYLMQRLNDAIENPRDPKYKGKSFSTDGYYPQGGAAGGTVKDHKADTVRPYSSADVRKHAAAAIAPSKWDPTIMAAAEKISAETGVPAAILAMEAKIRIGPESGGNPNAWNGGKGAKGEDAYGLMQLTPDTAKRYGVKDIKNPQQNIEGGMRFIGDIVSKYGRDNVDLYYYGGEGTKDHGPNTRQYVDNLAAVRALLPKEGIVLASAKAEATKPAEKQKKVSALDIRPDIKPNIKPDFKEVAGLTDQIQGADTRGLKQTGAAELLARQEENQKVGDPTKETVINDPVYRLASNGPGGGLAG